MQDFCDVSMGASGWGTKKSVAPTAGDETFHAW